MHLNFVSIFIVRMETDAAVWGGEECRMQVVGCKQFPSPFHVLELQGG
jgi:hypothetical protein